MIITVFGATGMVGKYVVAQALAKDYTVKAFGRNVESLIDKDLRNDKLQAIKGYVFDEDEVYNAIKGSDAVVSVLGGGIDGTDKTRTLGIKNIIAQMKKAGVKRIMALGGFGVLNADDETLIVDMPDYPEEFKAVGKEHVKAYQYLKESRLDFTFVCPPNILNQVATGNYITSKDIVPQPNNWQIAAGDIAQFMLDNLNTTEFVGYKVGMSKL